MRALFQTFRQSLDWPLSLHVRITPGVGLVESVVSLDTTISMDIHAGSDVKLPIAMSVCTNVIMNGD